MPEKSALKGLAEADRYYQDYGLRARELKKQGKKIIGYLCAFTPAEVITAAGFVPVRIKGDVNEPITKADTEMETIICPLVRSCFDMALKGHYEYLDGLVVPHACDSICRTYDIWKYNLKLPYAHFINMPHGTDDASLAFYQDVLNTFRTSLGKFAGKEISNQALAEAIKLHNQNRAKVKELYELRKASPPLVSGEELTKVLIAVMSLPVEESIKMLGEVIAEMKERGVSAQKQARIMVIGAQVDDIAFIKLIEDSGAWVVADDLCPGAREFLSSVDVTADPVVGLADRYLRKIKCGRTYREMKGNYEEYLEDRFGHMGRMIDDFGVDGVVLYIYKYCDPYGFEVPQIKSYIEAKGTPVLYLEDEYSMSTIGRLRTRIQAFLELLGSK
ncbi:MAG: 2-hydroxyacyl-CoA dehydratase [Dehalococcoidia bacterium]|nr:MAG: 2-hydroxyacyl-CoA dehydratase [Dehalococcoidia bacterium]